MTSPITSGLTRALATVLLLFSASSGAREDAPLPSEASAYAGPLPTIIFDTDMFEDVDDVGALAMLNELQRRGEANLAAVVVNTNSLLSAYCADAINTYFGHPDVPIGILYPTTVNTSGHDDYVAACSAFPQDLQSSGSVPTALNVYRKTLAAQPDGSVIIVSVGFLSNLEDLLKSGPDGHSPLNGTSLVAAKVRELHVMGGQFPSSNGGAEFNFALDPSAAAYVNDNWPTKIVYSGFEVGVSVYTGATLSSTTPTSSPVRKSYELYLGCANCNRNSWDLTSVYHAVRPNDGIFQEVGGGSNTVNPGSGANTWVTSPVKSHYYLRKLKSDTVIANTMESLFNVTPKPLGGFVKGINLNGGAVTIEGQAWLSHAQALSTGLTVGSGAIAGTSTVSPNPVTDSNTTAMLRSKLSSSGNMSLTQTIANGNYEVFLWNMEDAQDAFTQYDVNLEGRKKGVVRSAQVGRWHRYGPYSVTVIDGVLNIDLIRLSGQVAVQGIAIHHTGIPDSQAPTAPAGLITTGRTSRSVSLQWSAATDDTDVTGYDVYVGSTLAGSTTAETHFTATGLSPSTTYSFTVKAKDAAGNVSAASSPLAVTTDAFGDGTGAFVKGINLNGSAVTVEGNAWSSHSSALSSGFTISAVNYATHGHVPNPAADADTTSMLRSEIWYTGNAALSQTLSNGTYTVYLWVLEDYRQGYRSFDVSLEGTVKGTISTGSVGSWRKYGPFTTAVTDGVLNVNLNRIFGDVLLQGMVILNAGAPTSDTQAPSAPANLTSTDKTATSVSLSWSASIDNVGVTAYNIYQGTTLAGSTSGTALTVTGLTPSTTYSFTVRARDAAGNVSPASQALSVTTNASGSATFVKGININGGAVTIEGKIWLSHSAALSSGLTLSTVNTATNSRTPSPATDADTTSMLRSEIWYTGNATVSQSLPNGTYSVYLWVMEDYMNNFRSFDVRVEGVKKGTIATQSVGSWNRYGPYTATVSDGALTIDLIRLTGDILLQGIAIYQE